MSLLQTKLYVPGSHGRDRPFNHVGRPRLLARLNAGCTTKLTVVCAPPGFGKSTLLSEWIADLRLKIEDCPTGVPSSNNHQSSVINHVAWLSLDDGDNDPIRFWMYFVAALQTVDADIGTATLASAP